MNETIVVRVDKREGKKPWVADWGGYVLPYSSISKLITNTFSRIRNKPHNLKWEHFEIIVKEVEDAR